MSKEKISQAEQTENRLREIYSLMFSRFGPQFWWPGETPLEISIGAILTQNTNWGNVERAIHNLKRARALSFNRLRTLDAERLAELIRPAGYYNVKARRMQNFLALVHEQYGGRLDNLFKLDVPEMRQALLSVNGIGRETADSIILYAAAKPIFVVDAYTRRIFSRHKLIHGQEDYDVIRGLFEKHLSADAALFNEYHALLVRLAKEFCRTKPCCRNCPLETLPHSCSQRKNK